MEALRNTEVAFVNELKFDTQNTTGYKNGPQRIQRPPEILILKSPPGKELLTIQNMGK